jgi:hypothetical protein
LGYGAKPHRIFFEKMALYDELPVFKAAYDLLLDIFRFSATLTREYKYTLGEKLKNETLEMLMLVYRANSTKEKHDTIQKAREQIEMVRLLLRVLKDLNQISVNSFVRVNQQVENVSKQLTGWQKSQK